MKTWLFRLALSTILLCALIGIDWAAGFYRDTAWVRASARQFRSEAGPLLLRGRQLVPDVEHRYFDGRPIPRSFRTGPDGTVLGPAEPASRKPDLTILFLGGSTTETNEVDEAERFPYVVGHQLSKATGKTILTLNLGVRGNTSRDSINLLINHPVARRVDVVVLMHNINDRLLLALSGTYEAPLATIPEAGWSTVSARTTSWSAATWDAMTYSSNILFLLRRAIGDNPWTGEARPDAVTEDSINYPDKHFARSRLLFEESVTLFVAATNALGKTPVLLTQPLGRVSQQQASFNDVVREVAERTGTNLIDLDRTLPSDRGHLFLGDDIHLNNAGSRGVADIIAAHLARTIAGVSSEGLSMTAQADFSICQSYSNADSPKAQAIPKRELLPYINGRYPVVAFDGTTVLYQSYQHNRERVFAYDIRASVSRAVTPLSMKTSDRHAVPYRAAEPGRRQLVLGRKTGPVERLVVVDVESSQASPLPLPENLSSSIPSVDALGNVYFAGGPIDEVGKHLGSPDLYRYDPHTDILTQLTKTPYEEWRPIPSSDSRFLYFIANPQGQFDIFRLRLQDGATELVFATKEDEWDPHVSADGRWLVYASKTRGTWDIYLLDLVAPLSPPRVLSSTSEEEWDPRFVDGSHAIVFASEPQGGRSPPRLFWLCPFGERGARKNGPA